MDDARARKSEVGSETGIRKERHVHGGDWCGGVLHSGARDRNWISCAEPEGVVDDVHIRQRIHCRPEQKGKIALGQRCGRSEVYP